MTFWHPSEASQDEDEEEQAVVVVAPDVVDVDEGGSSRTPAMAFHTTVTGVADTPAERRRSRGSRCRATRAAANFSTALRRCTKRERNPINAFQSWRRNRSFMTSQPFLAAVGGEARGGAPPVLGGGDADDDDDDVKEEAAPPTEDDEPLSVAYAA